MQFQVLFKTAQTHEFLEGGFLHAIYLGKAHVVGDQRKDLFGVFIGETQAMANLLCHFHPYLNVTVKANPVGRDPEGWWLADIVQQGAPGKGARAGLRKFFQQQQRVQENVAFRMKLWWLLNPLHGGDFRQDLLQQASFIEQKKGAARVSFGQHLG